MSRDSTLKWAVILGMVITTAVCVARLGLMIEARWLIKPVAIGTGLAIFGWYYRCRGEDRFVTCVTALLHLVLFSSCYTALMYTAATLDRPLFDSWLMAVDQVLGFHVPSIVSWMQGHPQWDRLLQMSYNTLLPQTAIVIAILGLSGDRHGLEAFIRRFMIAAIATLAIFCLFPAAGPFAAYGFEPLPAQQRYLQHFMALRGGTLEVLPLDAAEGLITFPSFHTAWAILMAAALCRRPVLFAASALLNGAVVISTITTGWHYAADTLAGVVVTLLAIVIGGWLIPRRHTATWP